MAIQIAAIGNLIRQGTTLAIAIAQVAKTVSGSGANSQTTADLELRKTKLRLELLRDKMDDFIADGFVVEQTEDFAAVMLKKRWYWTDKRVLIYVDESVDVHVEEW